MCVLLQAVAGAAAGDRGLSTHANSAFVFCRRAGKAAGDKRANVAERAFGKPFAKIVIEECGLL